MEHRKGKLLPVRIIGFIIIFAIAVTVAYYFSDEFRLAEKPAEYTGLFFSILAAALFAVVSIVGDPGMLVSGNSRRAWNDAKDIQLDLQNFNLLLVWYLLTLGLLVVSELVEHAKYVNMYWITNVFVFFATFGFLVSLFLPFEFAKIQRERLQSEINNRSSKG